MQVAHTLVVIVICNKQCGTSKEIGRYPAYPALGCALPNRRGAGHLPISLDVPHCLLQITMTTSVCATCTASVIGARHRRYCYQCHGFVLIAPNSATTGAGGTVQLNNAPQSKPPRRTQTGRDAPSAAEDGTAAAPGSLSATAAPPAYHTGWGSVCSSVTRRSRWPPAGRGNAPPPAQRRAACP